MDSLIALIIGLALGIGFYYYDLKKGAKAYRNWYNITNKNKMEAGKSIGFVFNQPFSKRLIPAIGLALLFCLVMYITGNLNMIMILIYSGVVFLGCMASFYIAPLMFKSVPAQLEKINRVIERVDEIEGEILEGRDERVESEDERVESGDKRVESGDKRVESGAPSLKASELEEDERVESADSRVESGAPSLKASELEEDEGVEDTGDDDGTGDKDDDWRKGVKDFLDK